MEISFHIPNSNTQFIGDETHPPAQVNAFSLIYIIDWFVTVASIFALVVLEKLL